GRVVAVTHPAVIRAATVHAFGAPAAGFWRIDVRPLAQVRLHGRGGRWSLRLG
ncbi:histidine phosphatase, partial [Rhodococcus rhodochrous]